MKITKYFLSMAAAVGMIVGCQKAEMVQISAPEDVVAPVLKPVAEINITATNLANESVTFEWSAADFGVKTQVNYAIEVSKSGSTDKTIVTSGVTTTSSVVTYESINAILLYDLGLASGVSENVEFYVSAKVGEYAKVYSNPVATSATVTEAEKEYPKLTVAGSYPYNNWTPGKGQFVFDFDGDDDKYSGIIDFGEDVSSLNFKFVGSKWGENEFSVPSGEAQAPEAAELPLVAGGGDNIAAYTTHRYYNLTLVKSAPKVIKNFSFNSLGVIGDATPTGWDSDTDMAFNAEKQRFYVDMTLADGTIKFRANDGWDVNWGGADGVLASGGADIAVKAGNYRIYVNLNDPANLTYELNDKMYGQPEDTGSSEPEPPVEPEQPANEGWGIVGTVNNWGNDGPDVAMKLGKGWFVATNVELPDGGEIKFRLDGAWDVNFGGTWAVDTMIELSAGGSNIATVAGTYDIYLNPDLPAAYIMTAGASAPAAPETWGIVGTTNNWGGDDIDMGLALDEEGKYWVRKGVVLPDGEIKFRWANDWGKDFGGTWAVDAEIAVEQGGSNFKCVAGTYDVYLDAENAKAFFMTEGKTPADAGEAVVTYIDASTVAVGFSGTFNGWGDPADAFLAAFDSKELTDEATYAGTYVFKASGIELTNGAEFKIRINSGWFGTAETTIEGLSFVDNGGNIAAGEGGTFNVEISFVWDGLEPSEVKAVFSK